MEAVASSGYERTRLNCFTDRTAREWYARWRSRSLRTSVCQNTGSGDESRWPTQTGEDSALFSRRKKIGKARVCTGNYPANRANQHRFNAWHKRCIRAHVEPEQLKRRVRIVGDGPLLTR